MNPFPFVMRRGLLCVLGCLIMVLQGCVMLSSFGPASDNIGRTHVAIEGVEGIAMLRGDTVLVLAAGVYRQKIGIGPRGGVVMYETEKTGVPPETWLLKMKAVGAASLQVEPPGIPWQAQDSDLADLERVGEGAAGTPSLADIAPHMAPRGRLRLDGWLGDIQRSKIIWVETRDHWMHHAAIPLAVVGHAVDVTATVVGTVALIPLVPVLWAVQGIRRASTGRDE